MKFLINEIITLIPNRLLKSLMTHSVSDVMMIVNCLLVLALNDVSTNMGTTSGDELESAVLIKYLLPTLFVKE